MSALYFPTTCLFVFLNKNVINVMGRGGGPGHRNFNRSDTVSQTMSKCFYMILLMSTLESCLISSLGTSYATATLWLAKDITVLCLILPLNMPFSLLWMPFPPNLVILLICEGIPLLLLGQVDHPFLLYMLCTPLIVLNSLYFTHSFEVCNPKGHCVSPDFVCPRPHTKCWP